MEQKNLGVIIEQRDTDYVAGASPVFQEQRNLLRDWTTFVRPGERQSSPSLDAMDCVTQAICNAFETQVEWMLANKLVSVMWMQAIKDLGFMDSGRFQISRRFTATVSGTTSQGNSFQRVADSLRKQGIVAESKYPSPTDGFNWNTYYQPVPPEILALGQKSLSLFSTLYEATSQANIPGELVHCPIVIMTHVASGWFSQDPVQAEDGPVQHATQVFNKDSSMYYDEDSYPQFVKHLVNAYPIPYAYKLIVSPIDTGNPAVKPPPFRFLKDMKVGDSNEDVRQLQIRLGCPVTGIYDDNLTRAAVFNYQLTHCPKTLWDVIIGLAGRRCGPATRNSLNFST